MMRQPHKARWYERFALALGLDPNSQRGHRAAWGESKHGRARTQRQDGRRREKARRRTADASRRRNRAA
jgi:hypothetical protein